MKRSIKLCIGLAIFFTTCLLFSSQSLDASAVSITNGIYSTAIYTKNFESTKTTYNQGPLNIGSGAISAFNELNPTGIWDYTQALSFPNPYTDKTGTGFQASLYFTMHSTNGPFLNTNILTTLGNVNLGFENMSEDFPYCTASYDVRIQDSSTVQFLIRRSCPAGSYPSGTVFNQVEALVDYSPDSIFWCANDNPSQLCGSYMGVTVYNIDYYFAVLTGSNSYEQTVINQNQTIINQNQTVIDRDNQDRSDLQNQTDSSSDSADSLGSDISSGGQRLLDVITTFYGLFLNPPQRDCKISMGILFNPFHQGTYADADLCHLSPPPAFSIIATLIMIGATIPFVVSAINTLIKIMEGVLST